MPAFRRPAGPWLAGRPGSAHGRFCPRPLSPLSPCPRLRWPAGPRRVCGARSDVPPLPLSRGASLNVLKWKWNSVLEKLEHFLDEVVV